MAFGLSSEQSQPGMDAFTLALAEYKRLDIDFDTAWQMALERHRAPVWMRGRFCPGETPLEEFARARFERAYRGLNPSIVVCPIEDEENEAA